MRSRMLTLVGALAATCVTLACTADPVAAPDAQSDVIVRAQLLGSSAGLVVDVSGPGITPALLFNIPAGPDSVATDTLSVPAGGARRFIITAIDTLGFPTHRADSTVNLVAGVHTPLALVLRPLTTNVGITITIGSAR